ncbi:MAG: hypothetical protein K2X91_18425, partial [Thermoleophilia bacterium]|nr:hypothetical protein [Thermoleophilia bacterium]
EFLPAADRALLLAIYEQGRSLVELAPIMGLEPRSIGRRVRRLVRRISQPAFALAALRSAGWAARDGEWRDLGRVARACVLEGQTLRAAARSLKMSVHAVRRHRETVIAMARGAQVLSKISNNSAAVVGTIGGTEGGAAWRGSRGTSRGSIGTMNDRRRAAASSAPWRRSG